MNFGSLTVASRGGAVAVAVVFCMQNHEAEFGKYLMFGISTSIQKMEGKSTFVDDS